MVQPGTRVETVTGPGTVERRVGHEDLIVRLADGRRVAVRERDLGVQAGAGSERPDMITRGGQ